MRAKILADSVAKRPTVRSISAFYTLKRFDPFSPICIILTDGKANSKEADHSLNARAGQAIHQSYGRADGTGR
jgi:lipoprotein NlpI